MNSFFKNPVTSQVFYLTHSSLSEFPVCMLIAANVALRGHEEQATDAWQTHATLQDLVGFFLTYSLLPDTEVNLSDFTQLLVEIRQTFYNIFTYAVILTNTHN